MFIFIYNNNNPKKDAQIEKNDGATFMNGIHSVTILIIAFC